MNVRAPFLGKRSSVFTAEEDNILNLSCRELVRPSRLTNYRSLGIFHASFLLILAAVLGHVLSQKGTRTTKKEQRKAQQGFRKSWWHTPSRNDTVGAYLVEQVSCNE